MLILQAREKKGQTKEGIVWGAVQLAPGGLVESMRQQNLEQMMIARERGVRNEA